MMATSGCGASDRPQFARQGLSGQRAPGELDEKPFRGSLQPLAAHSDVQKEDAAACRTLALRYRQS